MILYFSTNKKFVEKVIFSLSLDTIKNESLIYMFLLNNKICLIVIFLKAAMVMQEEWDSDRRMTALARASSNCKRQTRPLVRKSAPHQQTRNSPTVIKIWS
jgi:hypothetical protein